MAIVFRQEGPGRFDLLVDGRASAYDLEPDEFQAALKRARLTPEQIKGGIWTEDLTGYRERLGR